MNLCIKMILPLILGISLTFISQEAAAEFKGCNEWCGSAGNKATVNMAWNDPQRPIVEKRAYDECMAQTRIEHDSIESCNGAQKAAEAANPPLPQANPLRCESDYKNLLQQCESEISAATTSCDETTNADMIAAKREAASASANSSSSISDSCSKSQALSASAQAAMTSYRDLCSAAATQCSSKCSALAEWAESRSTCFPLTVNGQTFTQSSISSSVVSPKSNQCQSLQAKASEAGSSIDGYASNASSSGECASQTAGGSGGIDSGLAGQIAGAANMLLQGKQSAAAAEAQPTFCELNPTAMGCGNAAANANCSDPTQANNKVCICAANPTAPQCAAPATASDMAFSGGSMDSSSRLSSPEDNGGGDLPQLPFVPTAGRSRGGDSQGVDGSQGGGTVGSSTVSAGGGNAYKTSVANDIPLPSSGGGGFHGSSGNPKFGSTGSSGSGSGSGGGTQGSYQAATNGGSVIPDLRQFLPGGVRDPKARGIAGASGVDGITGPHSNIWQKVQNRYQILRETLYP